jgi:large subunit ribosomal protein L28e
MNLTNKHTRKHAGFINDQAIGIQPDSNTARLLNHSPPFSLI